MSETARHDEPADPWVIPLHGIEAPAAKLAKPTTPTTDNDEALTEHLYSDDELPTLEFRPRLRRSA